MIKIKKVPTEFEIKIFKEQYPVMDKDWKKIKAFVFNKYKNTT